ncbi:MAG: hypothetical protein LBK42_11610 [Propionibacteriaceae bacterium]|nr:hypothetical protein [Propionibacteriaceae bacterium]
MQLTLSAATDTAANVRDSLGHLVLAATHQAKVNLRELSAASGLHHSMIKAMLHRAIGPGPPTPGGNNKNSRSWPSWASQ